MQKREKIIAVMTYLAIIDRKTKKKSTFIRGYGFLTVLCKETKLYNETKLYKETKNNNL